MVTNPADVLLQEYGKCADPERAELLLENLVTGHALPDIRKAVARKLGFQNQASDVDDVVTEAAIDLAARLSATKDAPLPFAALTAVAMQHATTAYLRRKHPIRYRVETRVRYLHTTEKGLAMWESKGDWLCGLATWQTAGAEPVSKAKLDKWRDALKDVPRGRNAVNPADLALTIFERLGAPVLLDDLTGIFQEVIGFADAAPVARRRIDRNGPLPARRVSGLDGQTLGGGPRAPVPERSALLLGLSAAEHQSAVVLLQLTRVAGIPRIAEALAIPAAELVAIWNQLPLDDAGIAQRLGVTPQRVIALRTAAFEGLKVL